MGDKIVEERTNQSGIFPQMTNSVEQDPAGGTDSCSAGQEIPCHLWIFHYCLQEPVIGLEGKPVKFRP
jgi:hypothetical protein